jgi:hypothetical protein
MVLFINFWGVNFILLELIPMNKAFKDSKSCILISKQVSSSDLLLCSSGLCLLLVLFL